MFNKARIVSLALMAILVVTLAGCVGSTLSRQDEKDAALRSRLRLATEYLRVSNHVGARDHLQRALEIDSRSAEAYDLMALLYAKELEPEVAEQHYRDAIRYDPDFTRARNNYGSFLYSLGRYDDAIEQFKKGSADLDYPLRYEVFGKLGLSALKLEQREQARKSFEKAIALNPRWSLPYLELASIAYEDRDYRIAERYLKAFDQLNGRPTARSLWLGIRIDDVAGKKDKRDSKALALKNLFPKSEENLAYQNWLKNGRQHGTEEQ